MKTRSALTRRDFLNGVALSLAAGTTLSPAEILARSEGGSAAYPPGLTGMRGSHDGSFEVAHALAREGRKFAVPRLQTDATYDLVIAGGGISGLSAAKFFRDRHGPDARILILDNHDDFGGHARRNEFEVGGKQLIGYGGSQSIESPGQYSKVAQQLLRDLVIDTDRFYQYFDQEFFSERGMGEGIYFDKKTFGVDRLSVNPLRSFMGDGFSAAERQAAIAAIPIGKDDQAALARLLEGGVDYLDGMTRAEKIEVLRNISYLDFLENYAGMPQAVLEIMQDTFLPLIGLGWEADSAKHAADYYFPGTSELGVLDEADDYGDDEPYIFHFPDGNASIARALVRDLIPGAVPGTTMEDLVTAPTDYSRLDADASAVRLRLNSTVVNAINTQDGKYVDVTYVTGGNNYRVRCRHAVMACYNGIIPSVCPEMPVSQVEAIRYATKIPFVIGTFAIRKWQAFLDAGMRAVYSPGDVYFKRLSMDFPVSMGDYHYPQKPEDPAILSAWFSPTTRGLPAKAQYRAGRAKLMEMSYSDFEQDIYAHLDGMLGPHGFDAGRDIAGITLNRWSHGYAYEFEGIGHPPEYGRDNGPHIAGRAQLGRISIANSDSEAYAYVSGAIDAADRAVNEQLDG